MKAVVKAKVSPSAGTAAATRRKKRDAKGDVIEEGDDDSTNNISLEKKTHFLFANPANMFYKKMGNERHYYIGQIANGSAGAFLQRSEWDLNNKKRQQDTEDAGEKVDVD
jgi:hypothetical protein